MLKSKGAWHSIGPGHLARSRAEKVALVYLAFIAFFGTLFTIQPYFDQTQQILISPYSTKVKLLIYGSIGIGILLMVRFLSIAMRFARRFRVGVNSTRIRIDLPSGSQRLLPSEIRYVQEVKLILGKGIRFHKRSGEKFVIPHTHVSDVLQSMSRFKVVVKPKTHYPVPFIMFWLLAGTLVLGELNLIPWNGWGLAMCGMALPVLLMLEAKQTQSPNFLLSKFHLLRRKIFKKSMMAGAIPVMAIVFHESLLELPLSADDQIISQCYTNYVRFGLPPPRKELAHLEEIYLRTQHSGLGRMVNWSKAAHEKIDQYYRDRASRKPASEPSDPNL